jgi:hypothetical protein
MGLSKHYKSLNGDMAGVWLVLVNFHRMLTKLKIKETRDLDLS